MSANPSPPPQYKLSFHSGNGNLRGGGVRPISSKSFLQLGQKMERRIGPVLLLCLITIGTVLAINGLYHQSSKGTILEMIGALEGEILLIQQHELAQLAGLETTTMGEAQEGNGTSAWLVDGSVEKDEEGEERDIAAIQTLIRRRAGQISQLETFKERFREIDLTIWSLIILSILGLLLTGLGMLLLRTRGKAKGKGSREQKFRTAYKVVLLLVGLLLMVQFLLLLFSLLPNSIALPNVIDQLFGTFLAELPMERRSAILEPIEDGFGCKLKVDHELLERIGLQEQCLPKIKDRLLAPYIVLFLLLIAIIPLLFAVFTFLWAIRLKNWKPIKESRKRIGLNQGERRPQSREEILARALGSNPVHREHRGTLEERSYY